MIGNSDFAYQPLKARVVGEGLEYGIGSNSETPEGAFSAGCLKPRDCIFMVSNSEGDDCEGIAVAFSVCLRSVG
jgi:hypothetical protein